MIELPAALLSEYRGPLARGATVEFRFEITNAESQDLELEFKGTGCSCYGVLAGDELLAPGRTWFVPAAEKIEFSLRGQAPEAPREAEYRAVFLWRQPGSNTPPKEQTVLARQRFYADLTTHPSLLSASLPTSALGQPLERAVEVVHVARSKEELAFGPQLEPTVSWIKFMNAEQLGPVAELAPGIFQQRWQMVLQLVPPENLTADPLPISLSISCPRGPGSSAPAVQFPVRLRLETPLLYPASVALGRLVVGEPRTRRLYFSSPRQQPFGLGPLRDPPHGVELEAAAGLAVEHWLTLSVTPSTPGPVEHELHLPTTHPELPEIVLKVSGTAVASEQP